MIFEQENNLYRTGWIDLVFAKRNQQYGAYVLRKEYSDRLLKALFFSILLAAVLVVGPYLYLRASEVVETPVALTPRLPIDDVFKMRDPEQSKPAAPKKAAAPTPKTPAVATMPVPADISEIDPEKPEPIISNTDVTDPSPVEAPGDGTGIDDGVPAGGSGTGSGQGGNGDDAASSDVVLIAEKEPQFPGGQAAFARFIQKNLRYPNRAVEDNVTGKVTVSFIVERDGSISAVNVIKGIGYGCDEEAIRVLKKAPAWIPGEQGGRKVRVLFVVPLMFSLQN